MKIKSEKRLFVGISVECNIKYLLTNIQSSIQYNTEQIRWISPKNIHITISFLGNIFLDNISQLVQAIEQTLNIDHFILSIEKTGVFPSARSPKILWLGIGNELQKLTKLHSQIEEAVSLFKVNRKKEEFIPHITVGRVSQFYWKIDVLPFLKYVYSPIQLDINSVALYDSQPLPKGTEYKILTEFPLN